MWRFILILLAALTSVVLTNKIFGSNSDQRSFPTTDVPSQQNETVSKEDTEFERNQTAKLLGVAVEDFPSPQGLTGFDEVPADAPVFRFSVREQPPTGPAPLPYYERRPLVEARAPDGTLYEAFSGRDEYKIIPDKRFVSTPMNTRQRYGTHHGYVYNPQDVYIGKREASRIRILLFFRDIGSHATAPHHFAIDSRGMVHLVVADVNIFQFNRLDLYWVIGDLKSGKWISAWQIDRRGFTSWSHPWTGAQSDKVNLVWNWCDESVNKNAPGMGVFHLEWSPQGFGRKVRVVPGVPRTWAAAIHPRSGRILIAFSKDERVYVVSRDGTGKWTRPALLHPQLSGQYSYDLAVEATGSEAFKVRTNSENTREWFLRPQ
jgi:hypothetical protein